MFYSRGPRVCAIKLFMGVINSTVQKAKVPRNSRLGLRQQTTTNRLAYYNT